MLGVLESTVVPILLSSRKFRLQLIFNFIVQALDEQKWTVSGQRMRKPGKILGSVVRLAFPCRHEVICSCYPYETKYQKHVSLQKIMPVISSRKRGMVRH